MSSPTDSTALEARWAAKLAADREALAQALRSASRSRRRPTMPWNDLHRTSKIVWFARADRLLASGVIHAERPLPTLDEIARAILPGLRDGAWTQDTTKSLPAGQSMRSAQLYHAVRTAREQAGRVLALLGGKP